MAEDNLVSWRKFVNSLPELPEGQGPPDIEKMPVKDPKLHEDDDVIMYKLTTTVFVYQHIGSQFWFGSGAMQDVTIMGEMSLKDAQGIVNAKRIRRRKK